MSAFHRPTPLMTGVSSPRRQTREHPKVCLSPPLSLSSPVIRKKAIQIPSFDEKGLIFEKPSSKSSAADKSSDLNSSETFGQLWWSKACHRNFGERASTLPRTKPKALSSQVISAKPNICISPAPEPNPPPTTLTLKSKPSDSLLPHTPQFSDFYPIQHRPEPKPSVSPTLTVPVPRRTPSPSSQCQENNTASQQERQPSPAAKERRARSISISNTKMRPPFEVKHDVLDQRTLLDFTHPGLRKVGPMTNREVRYQTETFRKPGVSQNSCSTQKKAGTNQNENTARTKPKSPHLNLNNAPMNKPVECRLREESASKIDVLTTPSNLRSKSADYTSRSNPSQSSDFTSIHRLFEQMHSGKRSTLPVVPITSSSNEPLSVKSETRVGRFDEGGHDSALPSGSSHKRPQKENRQTFLGNSSKFFQPAGTSQKYRFSSRTQNQATQMDAKNEVSQSDCVSEDYSCQSTHFNQKTEAALFEVKTRLVTPQTRGSGTAECTVSQIRPNFDLQSCKNALNQDKSFKAHKGHKEGNFRDSDLNEKSLLGTPDHSEVPTKLPECPWPPTVDDCSFNTSRSGISPKREQRVHQTLEETTLAHQRSQQTTCSDSNRTCIMEDLEDPYYVTMYMPGSVYVDMSDIVPPEVRPKPAVPAKPPNVGAPSPSSPFPPQGLGIGGSAPPPSAIPVPIGSHGPGHGGSHNVVHGGGHVGSHPPAHSGGHSHGGSHSTSGGSTLLGYIGIDTIIEQMRKKTMKTGFDFNIMVVGHSGLGKSTLMNTLFKSQVSRKSAGWARDEKIPKTVEIKSVSHVIEEGGVKMKLTVVDTPGFGDQINNDNCWEPISKYINEQFEKFLKEEVNITRKKRIPDTRVHCCLYFIPPTGHCLRQLDMEFMRRLSHSVNIIPVIAKSDTMTIEERQEFKQRVRKELETNGIEFYPQKEFDDDMEDKSDNDKIRETMPFAVVGSDKEHQVSGKRVLGRKTAWGIIEVENPNHCEFAQLRDFLIRSHLQDLKEVTHNIHYETYRAKRLNENGGLHPISSNDTQESNL